MLIKLIWAVILVTILIFPIIFLISWVLKQILFFHFGIDMMFYQQLLMFIHRVFIFSAFFIFFYDGFIITRIIPIIIFILNIYLTLLIAKKINRNELGIICSFLILINYFHIENSVVFMTVTFSMLIIQIFFYLLIIYDKHKKFVYLLGLSIGFSSISIGGWQIFIFIILLYFFLSKNKIYKDYIILILGFLSISIPWDCTYNYFGIPYYSNLNFIQLLVIGQV